MCALTSSRLDDFSDIVTYMRTVMTTIFFGRGSFYSSNTLDRTRHKIKKVEPEYYLAFPFSFSLGERRFEI